MVIYFDSLRNEHFYESSLVPVESEKKKIKKKYIRTTHCPVKMSPNFLAITWTPGLIKQVH